MKMTLGTDATTTTTTVATAIPGKHDCPCLTRFRSVTYYNSTEKIIINNYKRPLKAPAEISISNLLLD